MKRLVVYATLVTVGLLSAGVALAQSGDAESQAGSAWRSTPDYGPVPGTPEYYGNSGWPPMPQPQPYYGYDNRAYVPHWAAPRPYPAYPYVPPHLRPNRRDRDGDGVPNRGDRYPDDSNRY